MKVMPGYIQDSKDILFTFKNKIWEETFNWITFDIELLYTSIPHRIALMALNHHLVTNSLYSDNLRLFILDVTNFLMTHHFFRFDSDFYLQNKGVSMGAKYSPSLANLVIHL